VSVVTSCIGAIVNALSGLVTAAFLLRQLGLEAFGIWALVVSTTSLLWLLDFGTTVAVGRLIAARRAADDIENVNRVFSTAIALLWACATLISLVTWVIPTIFFAVFTVPPQDMTDVALALRLMALATAVHFIAAPFTCMLWGYERLDLINLIDIPVLLLRLALLFIFVGAHSPIWIVGACTVFTGCIGAVADAFVSFRVEPRLAPRSRLATRGTAKTIVTLGLDFAALNATKSLAAQLSPILVGHVLGNAPVAIFAVARQLSVNCNVLVSATTEAVAARSVRLFHENSHTGQQNLFIGGGRYTTALSCFLTIGLIAFGDSFIHLWQGGRVDAAYNQLRILMLGELVALSQWVSFWVVAGVKKQKLLAVFAFSECVTILSLGYLIAQPFGLSGISFAAAFAAALFRGVGPLLYAQRLLGVSSREYLIRVIAPNAVATLVGGLVAYGLDAWLNPRDWTTLFLAGGLFAAAFTAVQVPFLYPTLLSARLKPLRIVWPR
jgi:O-antigen/teichoic acid export membrane protein